MYKTRTLHISFNGFQTISSHPFAISHQRDSRWLLPSLETQLLSKKCLRELLNNLLLCSEERLSYIGTLEKVWMKCNSLKPSLIWTISSQNINNIKMLQLKKKENLMKKKKPDLIFKTYNHTLIFFIISISIYIFKYFGIIYLFLLFSI